MKTTTKSNEDYLEGILLYEKEDGTKSVDVANFLGVTKASVSIAMNDLQERGLIKKEAYGAIKLTSKGREIAENIVLKHNVIKKVLIGIGVNPETAREECCKIEHIVSDETLECLKKVVEKHNF